MKNIKTIIAEDKYGNVRTMNIKHIKLITKTPNDWYIVNIGDSEFQFSPQQQVFEKYSLHTGVINLKKRDSEVEDHTREKLVLSDGEIKEMFEKLQIKFEDIKSKFEKLYEKK